MTARRSNHRKQRNRGRFGFLYKFLSLVIILVVVAAGCVVFFRVEEITVNGETRYSAEEIIAASGVETGDNLFLIDCVRAGRRIVSDLPYVENVSIRRALPDEVVINVTGCVPAAVIQGGDGWWIIDAKGKLLEQAASPRQGGVARITGLTALLPTVGKLLSVEDAERLRLESLLGLLQALAEQELISNVTEIDITSQAHILISYDGRFNVKVPMSADFSYKMRTLSVVLESVQPNESGTIDLTRDTEVRVIP